MQKLIFTFTVLLLPFIVYSQDNPTRSTQDKRYYINSKMDSVIISFTKAIELKPKLIDNYLGRATIYEITGKFQLALDDYNKILSIDSLCGRAYQGRADVYIKMGKPNLQFQDNKRAIALLPYDSKTYYCYFNLALSFKDENIDTAIYYISKAIDLTKKYTYNTACGCYNKRGDFFFQKGDYQKAIDDYTSSINLYPDYYTYLRRSQSYKKIGKEDLSKQDYLSYEKLKPKAHQKTD